MVYWIACPLSIRTVPGSPPLVSNNSFVDKKLASDRKTCTLKFQGNSSYISYQTKASLLGKIFSAKRQNWRPIWRLTGRGSAAEKKIFIHTFVSFKYRNLPWPFCMIRFVSLNNTFHTMTTLTCPMIWTRPTDCKEKIQTCKILFKIIKRRVCSRHGK